MEETYHMYGMKITVSGDIDEARRRGQLARKLMFQTKNINSNNLDIIKGNMRLDDGTAVEVLSQHGLDSARIYVPYGDKKKRVKKIHKTRQVMPALEAYNEDREFLGYILFPLAGMGDSEEPGPDGWGGVHEFVPAADPESDDSWVDPFEWGQWLQHGKDMHGNRVEPKPFDDIDVFLTPKLIPYVETLFEIPPIGTKNRFFKIETDSYETPFASTGGMGSGGSFWKGSSWSYTRYLQYNKKGEDGSEPADFMTSPTAEYDELGGDITVSFGRWSTEWGTSLAYPKEHGAGGGRLDGTATGEDGAKSLYLFETVYGDRYRSKEEIEMYDVDLDPRFLSTTRFTGTGRFYYIPFLPSQPVEMELIHRENDNMPEELSVDIVYRSRWVATDFHATGSGSHEYFLARTECTSVEDMDHYAIAYSKIDRNTQTVLSDSFWKYGDEDDLIEWRIEGYVPNEPIEGDSKITEKDAWTDPRLFVNLSGTEHEIEGVFTDVDDFMDQGGDGTIRYYRSSAECLIAAIEMSGFSDHDCEYRYVFGYTTEDGVRFDDSLVLSGDDSTFWMSFPGLKGPDGEDLYVREKFRLMVKEGEQIVDEHEIEAV